MYQIPTVDSSISSTDVCFLTYNIEGYNFLPIAQRTFTISFWHKHTKAGIYCITLRNSGTDRSYVTEYTQSVSDTWEKATITVTASVSAGTWDYTTGYGLRIGFTLAAGSNHHTTANSWNTGNFLATSNQVNACDNVSNNFRIAQLSIVPGDVDVPFVGRGYAEELSLINRYLVHITPEGVAQSAICNGHAEDTNDAAFILPLPTVMRATPTLSHSGIATFRVRPYDSIPTSLVVTPTPPYSNARVAAIEANVSGSPFTLANALALIFATDTSAYLTLDARL